jgi:gliding motility-associated-like protein
MKRSVYSIICFMFFAGALNAQIPGTWTVNPAGYNYSMQVTCKLNQTCVDLNNPNNAVAAFVGGQCRGVAYSDVAAGSEQLALLVIYSNSIAGEKVILQVYNSANSTVFQAIDTVTFNNGEQIGGLNDPFIVTNNYAPSDIALSSNAFQENVAMGATIATLSATDNDVPNVFTFLLPAGQLENSKYAISGNTLQANSIYNNALDAEDTIRITVTDANNCSYTEDVVLLINNQNEPPTDIIIDTLSIIEDNPADFYISKVKSLDPDLNDTFTYTLVAGTGDEDNSQFYIVGDNLYISNKTNYDVKTSYNFRVRSTDAQGAFIEKNFTLTITDNPGVTLPLSSANYISPNGDGKNDYWIIQNVEIYKNFSLRIFDQFGHTVYEKEDNYNNEWDAKLNGNPLPEGTYYFIFKNENKVYKGNLTIVN